MITRLPAWVWVGAASLAMVAGLVNVVGYLGFEHQAVTHLTGTATLLGAAAVGAQWRSLGQLLLVIAAFVAGAVLSGAIIRDSTLRLGRRYGVALGIEAGAALFPWLGFRTLLVPAAFTGTIGIAYVAYRSWRGAGTLGA